MGDIITLLETNIKICIFDFLIRLILKTFLHLKTVMMNNRSYVTISCKEIV